MPPTITQWYGMIGEGEIAPDGMIPSHAINFNLATRGNFGGPLPNVSLSTGVDPTAPQLGLSSLFESLTYWHSVDAKFRTYNGSSWVDTATVTGGITMDSAYNGGSAVTVDTAAVSFTNAHASIDTITIANSHATGSGDGLQITMSGATPTGHALNIDITGATSAANGVDVNISQAGATGHCLNLAHSGTGKLINSTNFNVTPAGLITAVGLTSTGVVSLTTGGANVPITLTDTGTGNSITASNWSISKAGAATFAQTLTVSAGGAAITGNSTITGDLSVTGSLSFGGSWTVAATLTADEYIFDTDGVEPAGTNAYGVYDGTSLTMNVPTAKRLDIAVNGTDEYNFSATALDMNANALDNCGYVILNAATAPAATEVYLVNDNTGDLTLNALTTKSIHLAVANIDLVDLTYTLATTSGTFKINDGGEDIDTRIESADCQYAFYIDGAKNSVVLGSNADDSNVDRKVVVRPAAWTVAAGSDIGCAIYVAPTGITTPNDGDTYAMIASAWFKEPVITKGGTDTLTQSCTVYIEDAPTEGATNWALLVGAGSTGLKATTIAGTLTMADQQVSLSTGNITFSGAGYIALGATGYFTGGGATVASAGTFRLANATILAWRNAGNSADVTLRVDANDRFLIDADLDLGGKILYGDNASGGDLRLSSTVHATKGHVYLATGEIGFKIGGTADRDGTVGTNALHIFDGTAPVGALANGVSIYSTAGECYIMDAAGNATLQSPHDEAGDWIFRSYSAQKGKTLCVDMERLVLALVAENKKLAKHVRYLEGRHI